MLFWLLKVVCSGLRFSFGLFIIMLCGLVSLLVNRLLRCLMVIMV